MKTIAVIPARYGSTRLEGKPLADILGKPMIQWVWEAAAKAANIDEVLVATDDQRIKAAAEKFGARVLLTSSDCASGSDRVREASEAVPADLYINIQGDEPLIKTAHIEKLVENMQKRPEAGIGTLCAPVSSDLAADPNLVKVVLDHQDFALYFSRSPIPYPREEAGQKYLGHIGIYAYRPEALRTFADLPYSPLENSEKLEQLRFLQAGGRIHVTRVQEMTKGVDTQKDLDAVRNILSGKSASIADKLARIRLIVTDVDGVLTDGSLYYGADGEILKQFNARDGLGIVNAKKKELAIAIASGRDSPPLRTRIKELGIDFYRLGNLDKAGAIRELMAESGVNAEETLYIGDDITDREAFSCCSVGAAPANAEESTRAAADLVTQAAGGQGALREIIDRILQAKGVQI